MFGRGWCDGRKGAEPVLPVGSALQQLTEEMGAFLGMGCSTYLCSPDCLCWAKAAAARVKGEQTQHSVKLLRCHSPSLVILLPALSMTGLCMNNNLKCYMVSFALSHEWDTVWLWTQVCCSSTWVAAWGRALQWCLCSEQEEGRHVSGRGCGSEVAVKHSPPEPCCCGAALRDPSPPAPSGAFARPDLSLRASGNLFWC